MDRIGWILIVAAVALVAAGAGFGVKFLRSPKPLQARAGADATLLIRTDYSDSGAWARVRDLVSRPTTDGFLANVEVVEDQAWVGLEPAEVVHRLPPSRSDHALVILADARTMRDPEHPLLCVDPRTLESLRVIPSELWSIENNLSLANLDWKDFAEAADKNGVYRGFRDEPEK